MCSRKLKRPPSCVLCGFYIFYPDELLKQLKIIETKCGDISEALNKGAEQLANDEDVQHALELITSDSVRTNLHLTVQMIAELRGIAYIKSGVRGKLQTIFFARPYKLNDEDLSSATREVRQEIESLNQIIHEAEISVLK